MWDGEERRREAIEVGLLSDDIKALNRTILEMHAQNLNGSEAKHHDLEEQISQLVDAVHALALAVQLGDSKVGTDLAVHIAASHHTGTLDRLNAHETRLDGHDAAIGTLRERMGVSDSMRTTRTEDRGRRLALWGIAIAGIVGLSQTIAQLIGSAWQALATWLTTGPPPRGG